MNKFSAMLVAYLDQQLSADEQRALEVELQRNAQLRNELAQIRQLRVLLRSTLRSVDQIPLPNHAKTQPQRRNLRPLLLSSTLVMACLVWLFFTWRSIKPLEQSSATIAPATQPTQTIKAQHTKSELADSARNQIVFVTEDQQTNQVLIQTYGAQSFAVDASTQQVVVTQQYIYHLEQQRQQTLLIQNTRAGAEQWRKPISNPSEIMGMSADQAGVAIVSSQPNTLDWQWFDPQGDLQFSNATTTNVCANKALNVTTTDATTTVVCYEYLPKTCSVMHLYDTGEIYTLDCNIQGLNSVYQFNHADKTILRVSSNEIYAINRNELYLLGPHTTSSNSQLLHAKSFFQLLPKDLHVAYLAISPDNQRIMAAQTSANTTTLVTYQAGVDGQFVLVNQMTYDHPIKPFSMQFNRDGTLVYAVAAKTKPDQYDTIVEFDPMGQIPQAEYTPPQQIIRTIIVL